MVRYDAVNDWKPWSARQPSYIGQKDVGTLELGKRILGSLRLNACSGGGVNGRACGLPNVVEIPDQRDKANEANNHLRGIKINGPLRSLGHAPLFAQIGLIVALCLAAFQLIPVGFDLLFPFHPHSAGNGNRKRWLGAGLSLWGWGSAALLIAIILSV
ncbi:hypothetical protein [Reyranella sp.]|uniref:hypothetical protein n=1 Tax=Reyranella sp. TaxID=1929291 RepID=UPI003D13D853